MGIGEDFKSFCSQLTVNNTSDISSRYRAITRRLNKDFWDSDSETAHSYYVGSYGRGTAIRNFHDLDVMFILPWSYYAQYNSWQTNGQSGLLQAIKNSISRTYSSTSLGGDGQVVVVNFSDGMRFEILPAFDFDDGTYYYPNANDGGSWKVTAPFLELNAINSVNDDCNGNLKQLCRMARAWRRYWEVPIGGLLLDTLAMSFLRGWNYRDKSFLYYDFMSRDFLAHLASQNKSQQYWMAPGSGHYVYRKGLFEYKAAKCYDLALQAIEKYDDYPYTARGHWREIYGTFFPAS